MLEHPIVSQINRTGYPKISGLENVVAQQECCGISFYGTEILEGDIICIDHDNFDEIILRENLQQYCTELLGFRFDQGWVFDKTEMFRERWLEQVLQEDYNFEFRTAD